jgi:hypothetical protein
MRRRRCAECARAGVHDIAQPFACVAAGALAVACATGCGAARSAVSDSQFAVKANAICRHEQAKLAYVAARARLLALAPQSPRVIRQQAAQSQLATERLQALARPAGEAAEIGRWLTARTVAATVALDLAEAPSHGEALAVADVRAQAARTLAQASTQAAALGLRACSEVG